MPRIVVYDANKLMLAWTRKSANTTVTQAPLQVWWQASTDGGQHWTKSNAVSGFEAVSGNFGLTSDGHGGASLAALSRGASDETTLLYSQWTGATWSPADVTSLSEPSALGNSMDMTLSTDPSKSQVFAAMRVAVLQPNGARVFAPVGLSRAVVNTATVTTTTSGATAAVLPTLVPAATTVDTFTSTLVPTATPRPQINLGNLNANQNESNAGSNTLLISGLIAAAVVVVGSILVSVLRRRR